MAAREGDPEHVVEFGNASNNARMIFERITWPTVRRQRPFPTSSPRGAIDMLMM
jgi:hypothetical protein